MAELSDKDLTHVPGKRCPSCDKTGRVFQVGSGIKKDLGCCYLRIMSYACACGYKWDVRDQWEKNGVGPMPSIDAFINQHGVKRYEK